MKIVLASLKNLTKGFTMGIADVVPGVSGGTIALLLGVYERLLKNISICSYSLGKLIKADLKGALKKFRNVDLLFLLPLIGGMLIAIISLSGPTQDLLENYPESMSGLFFGLVSASIVIAAKLLNSWDFQKIYLSIFFAVTTFVALGLRSGPVESPSKWIFIISGSIAICAWILPGISGAFLLLIMGMYAPVLSSIDDYELLNILFIGLGALIGLAIFSTLLKYLLDNFRDLVLASLIGLMLGSIRVLWPWPNGVGLINKNGNEVVSGTSIELPNLDNFLMPLLLGLLAFIFIIIFDFLTKKYSNSKN